MNIVIAVHHFPPRFTGGAEWEVFRIAASLQRRGHAVQVICVERVGGGDAGVVAWRDETFEGIPVRRLHFTPAGGIAPQVWEYDNPWVGEHIRAYLAEKKPAVFHLVSGYLISGSALRAAHSLGIPTVVSLMDFWFLCPRIWMLRSDGSLSRLPLDFARCARCIAEEGRLYRWPGRVLPGLSQLYWRLQTERVGHLARRYAFLAETLQQAEIVIARSQFVRSVFIAAGLAPERIVLVRQGCDFADGAAPVKRKLAGGGLKLGFLGQIAWHKGVHVLFEALRRMREAPVSVQVRGPASASPKYAEYVRRAADMDARILLGGPCGSREETRKAYLDLDAVVVPSLWPENCPNVILEAQASGVPVVAADVGGIPELVRHGENGLLFERGNSEDLARQIRRLLQEPALLQRLSSGIAPVKTMAQETDELASLYKKPGDR